MVFVSMATNSIVKGDFTLPKVRGQRRAGEECGEEGVECEEGEGEGVRGEVWTGEGSGHN